MRLLQGNIYWFGVTYFSAYIVRISFRKKFFISECLFFLKGSTVIMAPLLLKREETIEIFRTLNFKVFASGFFSNEFLIGMLFLGFLSSIFISKKENTNLKGIMIMDFFSLIILNLFLSPILAFTLYYCFLHSNRHSITLIFELDRSFKPGFKKFIIKAIPLTFATAVIFLFAIYFLNNFFKLDEAITR